MAHKEDESDVFVRKIFRITMVCTALYVGVVFAFIL